MEQTKVEELLALSKKLLPLVRELDGKLASLKSQADDSSAWEANLYQAVHSSRRQLEQVNKTLEDHK